MNPWLRSSCLLFACLISSVLPGQDGGSISSGGSLQFGNSNPTQGAILIAGGSTLQTGTLQGNSFTLGVSPGGTLSLSSGLQIAGGSTVTLSTGAASTLNAAGGLVIQPTGTLTFSGIGSESVIQIGNLISLVNSHLRVVVNSLTQPPILAFSLSLAGDLELIEGAGFGFRAGDRFRLLSVLGGGSATSGDFSSLQLPAGVTGAVIREGNDVILRVDSAVSSSLINVSSRARVGTGDDVLVGGFVLSGSATKRVLLTAFGPSLANFGVGGALSRTSLRVFSAATGALIAATDGWRQGPSAAALANSGVAPNDDREAALLLELPPGAYTAVVSGVAGESGVGLLEVFDLDKAGRAFARPINLSSRARVQPGDGALIGGFVLDGNRERRVLVRALGPSLAGAGVRGALAAPLLELRDAQGTLVAANAGWRTTQRSEIQATGLAPLDDRECALIATLPPGAYTSVVRSADAQATGVGLVEMFDLE